MNFSTEYLDVEVKLTGRATGEVAIFTMVSAHTEIDAIYEEETRLLEDGYHTLRPPKLETLRFDFSPLQQRDGTQYTMDVSKDHGDNNP